MNIRLFATDLDGTLLGPDGTVSRRNFAAMRRACAGGSFVVPTTGRSFYEMPRALRTARSCYTHCICSNGAALYSNDGVVLWKSTFSPEAVQRIVTMLRDYDVMLEFYVDGTPVTKREWLCEDAYRHFRVDPGYRAVLSETRHGVEDLDAFLAAHIGDIEMMNVFFADEEERADAFVFLGEGGDAELTTSMQCNMEILQPGVNKGTALRRLCGMLGVTLEQTLAVGDSRNDLAMFRAAGVRLAVSNACEALKAQATAVICSNAAHSFAYAYSHYKPDQTRAEGPIWTEQRHTARSIS